jgi:ATP-dependent DNA helicase HFM1/MER3
MDICRADLELLQKEEFVTTSPTGGNDFIATEYGRILAKYYLKFETMKELVQLKEKASVSDIFSVMCNAKEFQTIRFSSDKAILNTMNKVSLT